jgi:hypothetical protein
MRPRQPRTRHLYAIKGRVQIGCHTATVRRQHGGLRPFAVALEIAKGNTAHVKRLSGSHAVEAAWGLLQMADHAHFERQAQWGGGDSITIATSEGPGIRYVVIVHLDAGSSAEPMSMTPAGARRLAGALLAGAGPAEPSVGGQR